MRVTAELNDERQKSREREKECHALKEKIQVCVFDYWLPFHLLLVIKFCTILASTGILCSYVKIVPDPQEDVLLC